jgi:Ni/Co efflux regulator RcnB
MWKFLVDLVLFYDTFLKFPEKSKKQRGKMKKNILLLMALCVLLSSASLFAQSSSLPMAQNFAAQDKDRDRDKDKDRDHDKDKHKKHRKHKDKDHDKDHDKDKHDNDKH